jgi:LacI family transcriptional regulator
VVIWDLIEVAAGLAIAKHSPGPTAIVAVNGLIAVGVRKGMQTPRCQVLEDISVIGFGGTRLAECRQPSLTTIDVHRETAGADGRRCPS